jgi:hypothetical protein
MTRVAHIRPDRTLASCDSHLPLRVVAVDSTGDFAEGVAGSVAIVIDGRPGHATAFRRF